MRDEAIDSNLNDVSCPAHCCRWVVVCISANKCVFYIPPGGAEGDRSFARCRPATVLVATLTVVVGRYFERKKELDALYRERKTEIYDEFLQKFFETFGSKADAQATPESDNLVPFLREFMRKLILWSGPEVIEAFVKWNDHLAKGVPDADSIFLTESFLLSIRKDLRHSNRGIRKGFFAKLFLSRGALFLTLAERNPKITLAEVAEIEKRANKG